MLQQVVIVITLTALTYAGYVFLDNRRRNPAGLPYPPGPPGYPIIGNLFDIPKVFIYKRFREMSRELGKSTARCSVTVHSA